MRRIRAAFAGYDNPGCRGLTARTRATAPLGIGVGRRLWGAARREGNRGGLALMNVHLWREGTLLPGRPNGAVGQARIGASGSRSVVNSPSAASPGLGSRDLVKGERAARRLRRASARQRRPYVGMSAPPPFSLWRAGRDLCGDIRRLRRLKPGERSGRCREQRGIDVVSGDLPAVRNSGSVPQARRPAVGASLRRLAPTSGAPQVNLDLRLLRHDANRTASAGTARRPHLRWCGRRAGVDAFTVSMT